MSETPEIPSCVSAELVGDAPESADDAPISEPHIPTDMEMAEMSYLTNTKPVQPIEVELVVSQSDSEPACEMDVAVAKLADEVERDMGFLGEGQEDPAADTSAAPKSRCCCLASAHCCRAACQNWVSAARAEQSAVLKNNEEGPYLLHAVLIALVVMLLAACF
jgi:hypothetical protein